MTYPFASLPGNLAAFCDLLRRDYGFRIGPAELRDAARACEVVPLESLRRVRDALRAVLAGRAEDVAAFDEAFAAFFFPGPSRLRPERLAPPPPQERPFDRGPGGAAGETRAGEAAPGPDEEPAGDPSPGTPASEAPGADREAPAVMRSAWSTQAAAGEAPVLAPAEDEWRAAARTFVQSIRLGRSRRWRPATRGQRFDLRRTLRASLHTGGEALSPRWRSQPRRSPRFVMLVDGSRSMRTYADVAMRMATAVASVAPRTDVFTFSTGLRAVTADVRRAIAGGTHRPAGFGEAWGGGTTIGSCLRSFLVSAGERLLGRNTVVVIASDGLDVGQPDMIRDAMRRLHASTSAIVWLNPLLATPGYEPTAAGMHAARPFITTFATVQVPADLAALGRLTRAR
jgi:uncharacterized protein with von Willebrand factor type A (vWA) domain